MITGLSFMDTSGLGYLYSVSVALFPSQWILTTTVIISHLLWMPMMGLIRSVFESQAQNVKWEILIIV